MVEASVCLCVTQRVQRNFEITIVTTAMKDNQKKINKNKPLKKAKRL